MTDKAIKKLSAKDYAISIPVDLSCKCGSKREPYREDPLDTFYEPGAPATCLDCGGTRDD